MLDTDICSKNNVMAMKEVLKEQLEKSVNGEELTEALVLMRTRAPDLESVRKLNCWACNIGDVNIVRRMPNLEVCSLTINKLTSLRDFSHCSNLQELYVRTNQIQHLSDIHYLKNLKKLRSLWLSENPCASRDNYRPTVLKVLPNLHKLDNVAVTEEEVARAQEEGDDLPIPDDFSFSAILKETASSFEDSTVDKGRETASVSLEKWARPRQKRQQKKREEYWREKRGGDGDARSGGDGSAQSGEDGGAGGNMRSSSDSADGDDLFPSTGSSRQEMAGQTEGDDNFEKVNDVNVGNEEAIKDTPITRAKWALNIKILDDKTISMEDNLELDVENLENVMNSDNINGDKNNTHNNTIETNEEDENTGRNPKEEKICQKQVQDVFVESGNAETESSRVSKLLNSSVFHEGNPGGSSSIDSNTSLLVSDKDSTLKLTEDGGRSLLVSDQDWAIKLTTSDSNKSLLMSDQDAAVKVTTSVFSIDIAKMTAIDSNTNANNDDDGQTDDAKVDQLILENHLNYAAAHGFKVTEQTDTPLLDNINLEDTLDVGDLTEGQIFKSEHIEGLEELKTKELTDLAAEVVGNETISFTPGVQPVSDDWEPVNWEEYNRMRVQLGVEPVNRIPITTRSFNSDMMRAKNANILQAVLCLVKELDRDSLDIVATVVKTRLDTI